MNAKEYLKAKGIHPTEPIYWDLENKRISLDELMDEFAEQQVKTCNKPAVMGSLPDDYWEQRCKLIEKVEEENPCDPDITSGQIEAWSNYHKFIKERGQRQ